MTLRSDAFVVAPDKTLMLNPKAKKAPVVDLDSKLYKTVQQYEALTPRGSPSLINCTSLTVKGAVRFAGPNVKIEGVCSIVNTSKEVRTLHPGTYTGKVDVSANSEGDGCAIM